MEETRAKIIVVGDSGVGKTALCHLLCYQKCLINPSWTIGCQVEAKIHEYKAGTPLATNYCLEFWDIGGSACHQNARLIFHQNADGVILVHDVSNKKSEANLSRWLQEVLENRKGAGLESVSSRTVESSSVSHHSYQKTSEGLSFRRILSLRNGDRTNGQNEGLHFRNDESLPVLVIGNKMDLVVKSSEYALVKKSGGFASSHGFEEVLLSCHDRQWLSAGTSNAVQLDRFFDRVIDFKHGNDIYRGQNDRSASLRRLVNGKISQ